MPFSDMSQQGLFASLLTFPVKLLKLAWHTFIAILFFPFRVIQAIFRGISKLWHWLVPHLFGENISHTVRVLAALFFILLLGALVCVVFLGVVHVIAVGGATLFFKDVDAGQALLIAGKAILVTGGIFIALAVGGFLLSSLLAMIGITTYSATQTLIELLHEVMESRLIFIAMFIVAVAIFGVVFLMISGTLPL